MGEIIVEKVMDLFKNEQFISNIAKSIVMIIRQEVARDIEKLSKRVAELEEKNCLLMGNVDSCEQYSRRNNLRIFGLPYEKNENLEDKVIKIFNDKMSIKTDHKQIEYVHRIKSNTTQINSGRNQPVIIRMDSQLRKLVFSKKKTLKGSGIVIREDLTKQRLQLYKDAANLFSFKNVWTNQGNIFISHGNKIHKIVSHDQLDKVVPKS